MSNLDFQAMSRSELKTYLFSHRDDEAAWRVFFDKLELERDPNTITYPAPLDPESMRISEEAIRRRCEEMDRKQQEG